MNRFAAAEEACDLRPAICAVDVVKRYGSIEALRGVSFSVGPGVSALVGHNGAGKTTLIKLLLGLVRPSSGALSVCGADPATGLARIRRRIGFLPESVSFNPALTGRETLAFFARLKGEPSSAAPRLLAEVGLEEAMSRRIGSYSKGMRQRLGLAQALLGDPDVLLLDEPTSGLDPELRQTVYDVIAQKAARGAAVLISSHALSELEDRAGRVIILDRGRLTADGALDELRRLAELPVVFRLRLRGEALSLVDALALAPVRRDGRIAEIDVPQRLRMDALRFFAQSPEVEDLSVTEPTLDALYAHFLRGREAES